LHERHARDDPLEESEYRRATLSAESYRRG